MSKRYSAGAKPDPTDPAKLNAPPRPATELQRRALDRCQIKHDEKIDGARATWLLEQATAGTLEERFFDRT